MNARSDRSFDLRFVRSERVGRKRGSKRLGITHGELNCMCISLTNACQQNRNKPGILAEVDSDLACHRTTPTPYLLTEINIARARYFGNYPEGVVVCISCLVGSRDASDYPMNCVSWIVSVALGKSGQTRISASRNSIGYIPLSIQTRNFHSA